ncbi:MAG: hypothetical protein CMJ25_25445 [Phycisphaerae bacterium]|nr:hypothetical protein [Phycisphaerae bacterium]|tara:strand:- start:1600 stop:2169 length:570 start_codon:yes stop_codon:yes gene_type:complete
MKLYKYNSDKLQYQELTPNYGITFLKIAVIFLSSILFLGLTFSPRDPEVITETEKILIIDEANEFSEEKLIEKIAKLNFKFPHIILAQSILETGHYDSKIFKENHNLFGMKEARVRLNLAEGTQYGHAYYNNWEESVMDYALWYSTYAYKCKTEKQLYKLLDKQYAEAAAYVSSLQHVIEINNLKEKFE